MSASPAVDVEAVAAAQGAEHDTHFIFWLLATSGLCLIVAAWLLPWFVEPVANGVGFAPQDVISSSPAGVGSLLVYVVGASMAALVAGFVFDSGCVMLAKRSVLPNLVRRAALVVATVAGFIVSAEIAGLNISTIVLFVASVGLLGSLVHDAGVVLLRGRTPFQFMEARAWIAVCGTVATLLIWIDIGLYHHDDTFGTLTKFALTDNAVWMMLTGMAVAAFAYFEGRRAILLLTGAATAGLTLTGVFVSWFRTDVPPLRTPQRASLFDAVQSFNNADVVLLDIALVAAVLVLAGFALDLGASLVGRRVVMPLARQRGLVALAGAAAATAATCYVVTTRNDTFGAGFTVLDERFGFVLAGLLGSTVLLLGGERMVASRNTQLAIVAFVIGGLFPLIFTQSVGFISWGASAAAIYVLLSLGLNVVVGFAGLLDLGYAAFFAIGAYSAASLNSPRHGLYFPFWVILFVGAAMAALFGAILGAPTLRLRGDYLAIVTLGFGEIVPDMAKNNFIGQTGGPNGITGIKSPSILGYTFGLDAKPYYWALIMLIALVMLALRNIERSRLGRAWMAIREDEIAAAATGINTVSTKLLAFSIGASVSGLAGAFYGAFLGIVTPDDFEFAVSVTALSTVVLGGIGNNTGAAVGALLISFIIFWILPHMQEWMATFGHTTGITSLSTVDYSQYKFIIYGIILMSVMLLRPGGLMPSRARRIELQTGGESESLAAVRGVA